MLKYRLKFLIFFLDSKCKCFICIVGLRRAFILLDTIKTLLSNGYRKYFFFNNSAMLFKIGKIWPRLCLGTAYSFLYFVSIRSVNASYPLWDCGEHKYYLIVLKFYCEMAISNIYFSTIFRCLRYQR